jgi:peptidyl-prolyl cis-trans isomerase C
VSEASDVIGKYAAILLSTLVVAHGAAALAGEFGLAAKVNGIGITRARLEATFNAYLQEQGINVGAIRDPNQYKQLKRQTLDLLISQELLWQTAKKAGFVATPEQVEQVLAQVRKRSESGEAFSQEIKKGGFTEESYRENLKQELSVKRWLQETIAKNISVSEEEIHNFYVNNPHWFTQPEKINARHILIKVPPGADKAMVAAARKKIEEILAEAKKGSDFAELAQKYSEGPSAPKGGELGFLPRGRLVKSFEEAAFALESGEISDVVRTHYGFHIIKLEARQSRRVIPEQEAANSIRDHLSSSKIREAVQERVQTLRTEGSVEILVSL